MAHSAINDPAYLSRRWRPALMSFFLRRTRNHAEAEDLTHEVFTRLLRHNEPTAGIADAYVFQVAANLLRDGARRGKVRDEYRSFLQASEDRGADRLDPVRISMGREALAALIAGLEDLPERTRNIFTLYRIEDLDMDAIAEGLGISKSAVKKHVLKAMTALMERTRELR